MTISTRFLSLLFTASLVFFATPALADQPSIPAINSPGGLSSSYNWAGYVASSGTFTSISASWNVPNVAPSSGITADAQWVGIGGVKSSDLIQVGTQASAGGSSTSYEAWYETLPGFSQNMNLTVNAGDSVTASLTQTSANQWNISLRDNTNGQNFQTALNYSSSLSSAEWIEEMPSEGNGRFIPLDNFGTVQFSGGTAVMNGNTVNILGSGAQALTMNNSNNQALATPSSIGPDGGSFSATRTSAMTTGMGSFGSRGYGRSPSSVQSFMPMPRFLRRGYRSQNYGGSYSMRFRFFIFR